jgi:HEAT repeat protein
MPLDETVADPASQRMLEELRAGGVDTSDFGVFTSLRTTSFDHARAAPVLLRWLPALGDPVEKERVVRHLTAEPEAEQLGAAGVLIDEFVAADDASLKWAIANALATLATADEADRLIELLEDRRHGASRQMLCDALKRTKDPRAPGVLIGLVDDPDVAGHAILALRLYGPRTSVPHLRQAEPKLIQVLADGNASPFARRQAGRALERLASDHRTGR